MIYLINVLRKEVGSRRDSTLEEEAESPGEALKKHMHLITNARDTQLVVEVWDDISTGFKLYAIPNCGWWTTENSRDNNRGVVEF